MAIIQARWAPRKTGTIKGSAAAAVLPAQSHHTNSMLSQAARVPKLKNINLASRVIGSAQARLGTKKR